MSKMRTDASTFAKNREPMRMLNCEIEPIMTLVRQPIRVLLCRTPLPYSIEDETRDIECEIVRSVFVSRFRSILIYFVPLGLLQEKHSPAR